MKPIDIGVLASAIRSVEAMDFDQKVQFSDTIHSKQPHALLTVLGLSQDGVSMPLLEHGIHILMVVYSTFYAGTPKELPLISLEIIEEARRDNAALSRALERGNLKPATYLAEHCESNVMVWVYD